MVPRQPGLLVGHKQGPRANQRQAGARRQQTSGLGRASPAGRNVCVATLNTVSLNSQLEVDALYRDGND